ncbi:MAG: OsmC family peroxiredoxin [Gammaproteobacteria bacterium]|nr:OsmC family peroxiredoxin [Gammaproteobacteria bacterium]
MSEHITTLKWRRATHPLVENTYDRNHRVSLGSGLVLQASAAPEYKGDPNCADPEELFVSALASCHMLTFIAIADVKGYVVESYEGKATGILEKGENGRPQITRIDLDPIIKFSGDKIPDAENIERMHASAHRNCFIANSITSHVEVRAT